MDKRVKTYIGNKNLLQILDDIERGQIAFSFKNNFSWDKSKTIELLNNIKKGYPIGQIVIWNTVVFSFRKCMTVGCFPVRESTSTTTYLADGFQRLSALYCCLRSPYKLRTEADKEYWKKHFSIVYDLENDEFIEDKNDSNNPALLPVYKLIDTRESFRVLEKLKEKGLPSKKIDELMDNYATMGTLLVDLSLSEARVFGGDVDNIVELLKHVNSEGNKLTKENILSSVVNKDNYGFNSNFERRKK